MANIQLLQGTEKIKDSYGKINTSLTNLNNDKLEKSGDTMTGFLTMQRQFPSLILDDTDPSTPNLYAITGTLNRLSLRIGGNSTQNEALGITANGLRLPGGRLLYVGSGSPEGVLSAPVGSIFLRSDGGTTTTLYVKTSGAGNTGWTAK